MPVSAFGALGNEFPVNTYTTHQESRSAVAMDDSGNFVIVWQSESASGIRSINAQRYNANGVPQSGEFHIASATQLLPQVPAVAMDADGDFVVVWAGRSLDQISSLIQAQRYNAAGVLQGSTLVAVVSGDGQVKPAVAMDADGDFVVTWQRELTAPDVDVYARRFNVLGVSQGSAFLVHASNTNEQSAPRVIMDAAGTFIITWTHRVSPTDSDIYARHFDAAGLAQAAEFRVNSYTVGTQSTPAIAADNNGNYVIAWQGAGATDDSGIYAQRYNAADNPQGSSFPVNATTSDSQSAACVTMSNDGKFLVVWESETDLFGRMYDVGGAQLSSEFLVNVETANNQSFASAAMNTTGTHAVVTWTNYGVTSDAPDVYARRFSIDVQPPIATPSQTAVVLVSTTITENEFYAEFDLQRAASPDIEQGIADFVAGGIDMTISLSSGEVGIVHLTVSNGDGFLVMSVASITSLNGGSASQNLTAIINRELPALMTATLDAILINRFGASQNVESVVIDSAAMTLTLISP